eukprot:1391535-Amorphochlora_amoeboformis.AAC.1
MIESLRFSNHPDPRIIEILESSRSSNHRDPRIIEILESSSPRMVASSNDRVLKGSSPWACECES